LAEQKKDLGVLALVAIVAIVGLIVLLKGPSAGVATVEEPVAEQGDLVGQAGAALQCTEGAEKCDGLKPYVCVVKNVKKKTMKLVRKLDEFDKPIKCLTSCSVIETDGKKVATCDAVHENVRMNFGMTEADAERPGLYVWAEQDNSVEGVAEWAVCAVGEPGVELVHEGALTLENGKLHPYVNDDGSTPENLVDDKYVAAKINSPLEGISGRGGLEVVSQGDTATVEGKTVKYSLTTRGGYDCIRFRATKRAKVRVAPSLTKADGDAEVTLYAGAAPKKKTLKVGQDIVLDPIVPDKRREMTARFGVPHKYDEDDAEIELNRPGVYVWAEKDKNSGKANWALCTAGPLSGGKISFKGTILSSRAIRNLDNGLEESHAGLGQTGVGKYESSDVVNRRNSRKVSFDFETSAGSDCLRFSTPDQARVTFSLASDAPRKGVFYGKRLKRASYIAAHTQVVTME